MDHDTEGTTVASRTLEVFGQKVSTTSHRRFLIVAGSSPSRPWVEIIGQTDSFATAKQRITSGDCAWARNAGGVVIVDATDGRIGYTLEVA